jgi:hypothetical protein
MKTNKEIKKQLSQFNETEKENLKNISTIISEVSKDGMITHNNFNRLTNSLSELTMFRENMMNRMFRLLKQNHMVD